MERPRGIVRTAEDVEGSHVEIEIVQSVVDWLSGDVTRATGRDDRAVGAFGGTARA
jgi:hypothetical protein